MVVIYNIKTKNTDPASTKLIFKTNSKCGQPAQS